MAGHEIWRLIVGLFFGLVWLLFLQQRESCQYKRKKQEVLEVFLIGELPYLLYSFSILIHMNKLDVSL